MAGATGLTIREAKEADAQAMLGYLDELTLEPGLPILLSHMRALSFTVESEQDLIRQHHTQSSALWLLALDGTDLLHAIYDRIFVVGPSIVSARLTPAAYSNGLALALPEVVMARPEGFEPPTI